MAMQENFYYQLKEDLVNYWIIDPEDIEMTRGIERIHAVLRDDVRGASITVMIEHDTKNGETIVSSIEIWDDGIETVNEINDLEKLSVVIDRMLSMPDEDEIDPVSPDENSTQDG